jgi:hypothetical protein
MQVNFDPSEFKNKVLGSRWRFIMLIVFFDILLIAMSLLSLQQGELQKRQIILHRRKVEYEQKLRTEIVTTTRVVTVVITASPR